MKLRSMLALLLALALALGCSGCGQKNGEESSQGNKNEGEAPALVYSAHYEELQLPESITWFNQLCTTADGVYGMSNVKVGERELMEGETLEWEGQLDLYENRLFFVGFDGTVTSFEGYRELTLPEVPEDHSVYNDLRALLQTETGFLELVDQSEYWNNAPEGVGPESEDYWNYQQSSEHYYLRSLDETGAELGCVELNVSELQNQMGYIYIDNAVLDEEGNLLVSSGGSGLRAFDRESGEVVYAIDQIDYVERLFTLNDGRPAAAYYGGRGEVYAVIEKRGLGEEHRVSGELYNAVNGSGDYALYYTDGANFYGVLAETGESVKLLNWIDCDIDSSELQGSLVVLPDGTVKGLSAEYNEKGTEYSVLILSQGEYDPSQQKTVLTLATQYLDWDLRQNVLDFNKKHEDIRIEIRDYSEYNTEEDWEAGLTKLRTEILSGNMPDLLSFGSGELSLSQLAAKGLLTDLYPLIDADPELSREDFLPSVLAAEELDGKLYMLGSGFGIESMVGASRLVGTEPGWTYSELMDALAQLPEGATPFGPYYGRNTMLQMCLMVDMENYVNWETGEVRFDSQDFIDLLNFVNTFPAEESIDYEDLGSSSDVERIAQGQQLLYGGSLYDFDSLAMYEYIFGGEEDGYTFKGIPTSHGVGNVMQLQGGYAISASCKNKEAAWQFVREFLTEDYQKEHVWNLPTNQKAFDAKLKEAMTPNYRTDGNGNRILDENGQPIEESRGGMGWGNGIEVEFYAVTQAQADKIMEVINGPIRKMDYSSSIFDIVNEQLPAFFAGEKSAEEIARLIQSKANIFVNEQR